MGRVAEQHPDNIANAITKHSRTHMMESQQVFTGEATYDHQNANGLQSGYNNQQLHNHGANSWLQYPCTNAGDGLLQQSGSPVYRMDYDYDYDSGTDTDTISPLGEQYDFSDIMMLSQEDQEQELFSIYQRAKGRFRQFMKKPVRRIRRFSVSS